MKKTLSLKKKSDGPAVDMDYILNKQKKIVKINLEYRTAKQNIESGTCIFNSDVGLVSSYASERSTRCDGICLTDVSSGERVGYAVSGIISNKKYKFSAPFGRPVWVSNNGMPTDTPPSMGYLRPIGVSISEDCFFLSPCKKMQRFTDTSIRISGADITIKLLEGDKVCRNLNHNGYLNYTIFEMIDGKYRLSDCSTGVKASPTNVILSYGVLSPSP